MASHYCLVDGLKVLTPDIPVLSEESSDAVKAQRLAWQTYWLIDPLDGTKEFIKKNGEFTVNVALIDHGKAVLGVVYAPVLGLAYWGVNGEGAFKSEESGESLPIQVARNPEIPSHWKVVGSRSHQTPEFSHFMKALPGADVVNMGSSLKLCLVAEGKAHLYPRLGPTSEWDTAAAQAVVEAAGGQVLEWPALKPIAYNTRPDTLLNPFFIVCAKPDPIWAASVI
jgi:3'(2'), 5'-bisphosphate nucleotidase